MTKPPVEKNRRRFLLGLASTSIVVSTSQSALGKESGDDDTISYRELSKKGKKLFESALQRGSVKKLAPKFTRKLLIYDYVEYHGKKYDLNQDLPEYMSGNNSEITWDQPVYRIQPERIGENQ